MGTASYEYHITLAATMIGAFDGVSAIKKEVDRILEILPTGTKYLGHSVMSNQISLTTPYVMVFEHPVFEDGTKIETDWVRDVYKDANGALQPINLFLGIRYYKPDGKLKYSTFHP